MDYYEQSNIGKARYVVNFYTGKKHTDGSKFYDLAIFSNKVKKQQFISKLQAKGYQALRRGR